MITTLLALAPMVINPPKLEKIKQHDCIRTVTVFLEPDGKIKTLEYKIANMETIEEDSVRTLIAVNMCDLDTASEL